MTRNDTSECDVAEEYSMQLEPLQQQQELGADNQQLSKNDKKTIKNKLRKKHPVYSNLRKAAKKSGGAAIESVKNNAIKVQDKRDNDVEQQLPSKMDESMTANSMESARLTDIPDSWELLYDLKLLPEKWTVKEVVGQESAASDGSSAATSNVQRVQSESQQREATSWNDDGGSKETTSSSEAEFVASDQSFKAVATSVDQCVQSESQQTESSSWNYEGDSKETTDSSEQGVEEYDKEVTKQKTIDISSTPSENISMHFLLRPQQLKESTSGSLRCSITIMDERQSQTLKSATSIESTNHLEISLEAEDFNVVENLASETSVNDVDQPTKSLTNALATDEILAVAQVSKCVLKVVAQQKHTFSDGSTQWDGIDDSASTSNDVETVNWSCELQSNEENEQAPQDCDDPYKNWMERPRRGTLRAVRYKTEMCRTYEEGLPCTYGVRCQFAHGFHELRFQPRHPKHKTELCHMFHSMGICRYGRRCSFVHTENPSLLPQMHFNQQQQQQQQQHQHHRVYVNENHYTDLSGLTISIDKVHSTIQSSCQAQDSLYKNCSDSDSSNYYDGNNISGGEKVPVAAAAAASGNQNYSNACSVSNDVTVEAGIETSSSNHFGSNVLAVQLPSEQHTIEESQQQMANAVVPSLHQEAMPEGFAPPPTANNPPQFADQKMVCFVNGAVPPVPWTNTAVLYVPYEACSFQNAEGQLLQPAQSGARYYNNNNNCAFYGYQQQLALLQPVQQRVSSPLPPAPPQQAVAAFQASNGIVYFNNASQIAPSTMAVATNTAMTTTVVNNTPFYASPFSYLAAAEPQHIYQQTQSLPGNCYAAAAQPVATAGNYVNKYYQVVPHLGAVPYGNVYYVAATNYPTAAYGNYAAYTTNA